MVLQNHLPRILRSLTPETDSFRALLRTIRIWFCLGAAYGFCTSIYVVATIPVQMIAAITLSLLFVLYAGLKGAAIGTVIWLMFALYATVRARFGRISNKP
jgi:hypothetical protein